MNESDRVELILNAVALVFILDIDEVLYSAITHADTQSYMENLQPWYPEEDQEEEEDGSASDSSIDSDMISATTKHTGKVGLLRYFFLPP